jgi:hypothetical protein
VLVTKERLRVLDSSTLGWRGSSLRVGAEWFLEDGIFDSAVLIAPKRAKYFDQDMRALEMLRKVGAAEKD